MTKLPPWLSAGQTIALIAFGKATPATEWAGLPELQETRNWRAPRELLLAPLEARAAGAEWRVPPGEWWTTEEVLAEIARLERETGKDAAALAEELRADIARIAADEARITKAKDDLRDKLAEGLIAAQGRRVTARGEQRNHEEIPASVFLRRDREIIAETDTIRVPDRIEWTDVQFRTADVLATGAGLVPPIGAAVPSPAPAQARRKPSGLDYRQAARPLVEEMRRMILAGEARNATDAARALARKAEGNGLESSKVTRLITRYTQTHGPKATEGFSRIQS